MQVNIHHLMLFYYVARYGGIMAAVRQMPYGIQQAAVSGQIITLEEDLGLTLFQRRPFKLTLAGEELFAFIEPFFAGLPRVVAGIRGEEGQHLRLAASSAVLAGHLPALLEEMREETPTLKLTLREVGPSNAEGLVLTQEADLAIAVLEGKPATGVKWTPLLEVPLGLYVAEDSEIQSFDQLVENAVDGRIDAPLISGGPGDTVKKLFSAELGRRGLRWETRVEVGTLELMEVYVKRGFGCGFAGVVPGRALPEGVRVIEMPGFPPLQVGLLHMGKLKPAAERFVERALAKATILGGK